MELSEISTKTGAAPVAKDLSTKGNMSADFETFLKMLTVQMQNQDPLNPVDSADYATQLATFSGVEQQVQTNDLLRGLGGQLGASGLAALSGWVGMEARAAGAAYYDGAPLSVVPVVAQGAERAELIARDASGRVADRMPISTDGKAVQWSGTTATGPSAKPGFYTFETMSYAMDDVLGQSASDVYAKVTEVQLKNGENVVVLAGGATVPASQVTAVRQAVR